MEGNGDANITVDLVLEQHDQGEEISWKRSISRYASGLRSNQPGIKGPYYPVIHYMSVEEFEALGDRVLTPGDIPAWE